MKTDVMVIGVGSPVIDFVAEVEEKTINRIRGEKGGMDIGSFEVVEASRNFLPRVVYYNHIKQKGE